MSSHVSDASDQPDELDEPAFEALLAEAFKLPDGPGAIEKEAWLRCLRCGHHARSRTAVCPHDGGPMVPDGDARIGQLIGPFRVLERLGGGGIGTVYRARHRSLGREAAIKFLRPEWAEHAEHRARLAREAQVIGQLDHEHVVRVIDLLTPPDGAPVLVMELVRGRTLGQALSEDGPFPPARALHIARQIARALARAHGLGVLHRDIKPSNVLLTRVGEDPDFVKVLDFGLARAEADLVLTRSQAVVGTPAYMSPEQARRAPLGPECDLYSLGCVLFELLTGELPFSGSAAIVMHAHVHRPPPDVRERAPDVPEAVAALVARLLQKTPTQRFADAHQLLQAIAAAAPGLPETPEPPPIVSLASTTAAPEQELERRLRERLQSLERDLDASASAAPVLAARAAVAAAVAARAELAQAAEQADRAERTRAERAERLGRALDSLGADLSEQAATSLRLTVRQALAEDARALEVAAVCAAAEALPPGPLAAGLPLSDDEAGAIKGLREAASRLSAAERAHVEAHARAAAAHQRSDDLRFQMDQLRGRLASLHVEARTTRDATQAQLSARQAVCERCLEAAAAAVDAAAEAVEHAAGTEPG